MPCYNCSVEFGILKKEIGCNVCGFSFCSRCCKRYEISGEDGKCKKQLCSKCFNQIVSIDSKQSKGSPPLAHKKRMEALKKQSVSIDSASHASLKAQWSDKRDQELTERLQRLKKERIKRELPSDNEIAERIAKLKGVDPAVYNAPPIQVFVPAAKSSSIEQADELMKQITEEVGIDSKIVKPEDEIEARLSALRDEQPKKEYGEIDPSAYASPTEEINVESSQSAFEKDSDALTKKASKEFQDLTNDPEYKELLSTIPQAKESDTSEDEMEADRLVEKLLSCNIGDDVEELDSITELDSEKSLGEGDKDVPVEEFPWCVICTEDAKIRCFGCEHDLYCLRCFNECHDSYELKSHRTCPYLPPAKAPV